MPKVKIQESGCRGCTLCIDICPVEVFTFEEERNLAIVTKDVDCIGCLSCSYACPSQCIVIEDVELALPFHRIEQNVKLVEQFLQKKSVTKELSNEEIDRGFEEIGILLSSFAETITEIMGRGHKSVGRRAGKIACEHLPEVYEKKDLEDLLSKIKKRFGKTFDFNSTISDEDNINLDVKPCGLLPMVEKAGDTPGKSDICILFHEYWAGLLSEFCNKRYICQLLSAGNECKMIFKCQSNII